MVVLVVVTITTGTKTATDLELYTNLLKLTSSRDLLRKMVIKLCTQEEEKEEEEKEEEEVRNSYSLMRFKNENALITYQEWRFNFESNNILIIKNMIKIARIESYITCTKINQIFRVQKMHVILIQFLKPNSCKSSSSSSSSNIHVFSSLLIDIVDICVIFLSMIRRIY